MLRLPSTILFATLTLCAQNVPAVNTLITSWPLGAVPVWQKWTVANSGSNFQITNPDGSTSTVAKAGATTQSISLITPGVNFKVTDCVMKHSTQFVGPTTLTATVGITGSLTGCISAAFNLEAAVSTTAFGIPTVIVSAASFNGTDAVILALTSTVQNISAISAGSVTVWIRMEYLP